MGISSKNKVANSAMKVGLQKNGYLNQAPAPAPTSGYDPPAASQAPAPQPFQPIQFAPRPVVAPYVTPPRVLGSGSGAQNAFASQQAPGYDPVANFLAQYSPQAAQQPAMQQNQALQPQAMNGTHGMGRGPGRAPPTDPRADILLREALRHSISPPVSG